MDMHNDFSYHYLMEKWSQSNGFDAEEVHENHNSLKESCNKENHTSNIAARHDKSNGECEVAHASKTSENVTVFVSVEATDEGSNSLHLSNSLFSSIIEADSPLWLPPEPEDIEDDDELSVANNDEDDDYSNGAGWGKPSLFSSLDEEGFTLSDKDKRRKAMMEAMHAQFRFLVSRFLASEGLASSEGENGNTWVDIIASLSWQAALLVKPDATEGRAMDPGFYVKVKCIACGSRDQSQVIKGLVFKKNTANKHMPKSFKSPKLLLLKGVLGERVSGLSSFSSMDQEKGYVKSVIEIIDACHPNVVLVEKTAPRDAQESLVAKGITLVLDMKFPRLEKIARCTGSRIMDCAEITMNTVLKKCDSFHVEKFEEEHNSSSDGGKRSSKTLMFFEGCPKPLGCTILLKGAHSEELKKIKRVIHYTVFAAYHLILETSFFADQRAISFDMNTFEKLTNERDNDIILPTLDNVNTEVSCPETSELNIEILVPNGSPRFSKFNELHLDIDSSSLSLNKPEFSSHFDDISNGSSVKHDMHNDKIMGHGSSYKETSQDLFTLLPGQSLLSFEGSSSKVQAEDNLLLDSSYSDEAFSLYYSLKDIEPISCDISASGGSDLPKMGDHEKEAMMTLDQKDLKNECADISISDCNESLCQVAACSRDAILPSKDNAAVIFDTQSILILFSSRCTSKETVCEQNQLSRIKYYGNFDMSLGRFLQEILLNQRHSCPGCGEPSEAHIYSYTHKNGKLTVQVQQLSPQLHLPGEKDGKLWMWTRCLKCQNESGIPQSTKRVIMSTAARGLSFGKFLELSFSSHSAAKMLSQCGHLLHRDCLRFFGFGSKVAMFSHSPVEIYMACKPPPVIEFNSPNRQEWFEKEAKEVMNKGKQFFLEIENLLQEMRPHLSRFPPSLPGSIKDFSEVEEMLEQEKSEFEASFLIATRCHGHLGKSAPEIVNMTFLRQDLLLGLYVWDCRLNHLHSSKGACSNDGSTSAREELNILDECNVERNDKSFLVEDVPVEVVQMDLSKSSVNEPCFNRNVTNIEIEEETAAESFGVQSNQVPHIDGAVARSGTEFLNNYSISSTLQPVPGAESGMPFEVDGYDINSRYSQFGSDSHGTSRGLKNSDSNRDIDIETEGLKCNDEFRSGYNDTPHSLSACFEISHTTKASGPEDWMWLPFPEMHKTFFRDHVYVKKVEEIHNHKFKYLTSLYQNMALHDQELLNFALAAECLVISANEKEISSIISCALAKLQDQNTFAESLDWDLGMDERGNDGMPISLSDSVTSSSLPSNGTSNLDRLSSYRSLSSTLSEDVSSSGVDGSSFENLSSAESLHPSIMVADDKATGKSKYSVVCIYAKQFYTLRKHCCPSELDYIYSLSRCKKWDAQGGKSKALFAKTLDDRFIIKEIKRTELDCFLKFGPDYFKHILISLRSGSQTCLAKILGMYQVKQIKGGKETKHDLLVMENLLYGRDVTRTYDLKGAVYARYISDPNKPEKVLLDQNFIEDMGLSPMYIGGRTKHLLQRAIWNDTSFLTAINVMDYSLLVGVDKQRHELIFGIIDYLRQYTWDKQLETWVKVSLVVPKNSLPTVISPKEYKKRFRKFMSKYFLTVPDSWASDSCPVHCKSCSNCNANAC